MQLIKAHDPQPAFVIDAHWNVLHINRGGHWLAAALMPWAKALLTNPSVASAPINLLDMLSHPEGFTKHMTNLSEVGPALLAHLRDDASVQPALTPKVEAFAALLRVEHMFAADAHTRSVLEAHIF